MLVRRLLYVTLLCGFAAVVAAAAGEAASDFKADWELPPGFDLELDTEGYELPTALAFVSQPGKSPKSPLYFVAELRGRIKVVTKDRSVYTFADVGIPKPPTTYPNITAQNGAAGMCLDQRRGYVFVTYSAFGPDGQLRNAIVRFQTKPRTFALRAGRRLDVKRIFAAYPTSANHQIGGCVVVGDSLFVGVGDGAVSTRARDLDSVSGKVLRMSLDGTAYPGNPFARGASATSGRAYVWAYGLRNPFGLAARGGALFATHNGNSVDSFLRIERGADYGWDGSDASISSNAEAVMTPAVGPVHLSYDPKRGGVFPDEWSGSFFFAASVSSAAQGAGVMAIGYDIERGWVTKPPRSFVRFRRKAGGEVAGVALGPDGLYFAPIAPGITGRTAVYRVAYEPAARYPHVARESGETLWLRYGCSGCHTLFGIGGTAGPPLDRPDLEKRIDDRLSSPEYEEWLAELDRRTDEPFVSFRDERRALLAQNRDERIASWIAYRIVEPRFDDPAAGMPSLGLDMVQARAITRFLLGQDEGVLAAEPKRGFIERARDTAGSKRFAAGLVAGFALALGLLLAVWFVARLRTSQGGRANSRRARSE